MQFSFVNRFDFDNGSSVSVEINHQKEDLKYFWDIDEWVPCVEGYILWWSDGVANEWEEFYPDLSSCLARLAVLVACGEHNFEPSFVQNGEDFRAVATDFFALTLS